MTCTSYCYMHLFTCFRYLTFLVPNFFSLFETLHFRSSRTSRVTTERNSSRNAQFKLFTPTTSPNPCTCTLRNKLCTLLTRENHYKHQLDWSRCDTLLFSFTFPSLPRAARDQRFTYVIIAKTGFRLTLFPRTARYFTVIT